MSADELMVETHLKSIKKQQRLEKNFEELSKKCPWRTYLKCRVLPILAENNYGGCSIKNCAFAYWQNVMNRD